MTSFSAKNTHLRVCPLHPDQIDQAFASLDFSGLPISLAGWRLYARDRIGAGPRSAGVLALQCARSYLHGLLGYRIVRDEAEGHMTVDLFRTVDYLSDKGAASLMAAAETIALEQRCSAIHFDLADYKDATIIALRPRSLGLLCQAGYAIDSIHLSKRLDG